MKVKLVFAKEKEFRNKEQEIVKGWQLVFLNTESGETFRHFVGNDNLKGFDPRQISEVKGLNLEISTDAKTYNGITKVVLSGVKEVK